MKYGGEIKQWDFAHLRYSFVVRTNVIKREKLASHAKEFRKISTKKLRFGRTAANAKLVVMDLAELPAHRQLTQLQPMVRQRCCLQALHRLC